MVAARASDAVFGAASAPPGGQATDVQMCRNQWAAALHVHLTTDLTSRGTAALTPTLGRPHWDPSGRPSTAFYSGFPETVHAAAYTLSQAVVISSSTVDRKGKQPQQTVRQWKGSVIQGTPWTLISTFPEYRDSPVPANVTASFLSK